VSDYGPDLALIHARGFTGLAGAAGPFMAAELRRAGFRDGLAVDLGCGNGITSRLLGEAGYDVLGIDASDAMLALARREAPATRFRRGSFLDTELPPCVGVLAAGEALAYTERSLDPLFRRVRSALAPGGVFVLDLPGPARIPGGGRARNWWAGDDWAILVELSEDRERALLTRSITTFVRAGRAWRRGEEAHRQRVFRAPDVAARLRRLGFAVRIRRGYMGERFAPGHFVLVARARPTTPRARARRARPA
jgi:SAM-dependent methyltransferase